MLLQKGNFYLAFRAPPLCLLYKNNQPEIILMAKRHIWGDVLCCPSGPSFPIILRMLFAILLHCISCFPLPGRLLCSFSPSVYRENPSLVSWEGYLYGKYFWKLYIFADDFILPSNFSNSLPGYRMPHWEPIFLPFFEGIAAFCFLAPSSAVVKFKSITESWSSAWWADLSPLDTSKIFSFCSHCFGKCS